MDAENGSVDITSSTDASQRVVLVVDRVVKEFSTEGGTVHALDNVSIQVSDGTFVALIGRSGCGKSTLLNLAGAMDFPTRGNVLLDGVCTSNLNENEMTHLRRNKVGFIFQSFQLLNNLSVVENVELPLLFNGAKDVRDKAIARLESVGIGQLADRMPYQLSGGQMQRVAIARALVNSPRLILADEPTGNLDTITGNSILELLAGLCKAGNATILMATHSAEAAAMADLVITLRDGRVEKVHRAANCEKEIL